jgi:hypothetical protein
VVPDDLEAALRDRERHAHDGTLETGAIIHEPGVGGVLSGGGIDPLRVGRTAAGGIDRQFVAGIGLEEGGMAGGDDRGMLGEILRRDGVERLIIAERIGMMGARCVAGGRGGDAAFPGGNGAGGIAGALGAERGQILAEPVGLGLADLRGEGGEGRRPAAGWRR